MSETASVAHQQLLIGNIIVYFNSTYVLCMGVYVCMYVLRIPYK